MFRENKNPKILRMEELMEELRFQLFKLCITVREIKCREVGRYDLSNSNTL